MQKISQQDLFPPINLKLDKEKLSSMLPLRAGALIMIMLREYRVTSMMADKASCSEIQEVDGH